MKNRVEEDFELFLADMSEHGYKESDRRHGMTAEQIMADEDLLTISHDEYLALYADRNDTGNSERIQLRFGQKIISSNKRGWKYWNEKFWEDGAKNKVISIARETACMTQREIEFSESPKEHKKFAIQSGNLSRIKDAMDLAKADLEVNEDIFDSHVTLINTPSGIVDITNGKLIPHDKELFMSGMTNFDYDPDADDSGIRELMAEMLVKKDGTRDEAKEKFLQVALGYSMRADNCEKAFFVMCGDEEDDERNGNNAKSTIMNFISNALGTHYVSTGGKDMLVKTGSRVPEAKTRLPLNGARICYISEFSKDDVMDASSLKLITGEERVRIKSLFIDEYSAKVTATPFGSSNTMPRVNDNSGGVWNRIYKIPMNVFYYNDSASQRAINAGISIKIDKEKIKKMRSDENFMKGVMRWLVDGAVEYHRNGLPKFDEAKTSLSTMKEKSDEFGGFFNSCIARSSGNRIPASELYHAYMMYATLNGEVVESQRKFGDAMTGKGIVRLDKGGKTYRINASYTPAGYAYANDYDVDSAMRFVAVNEGNGVTYSGEHIPDSVLSEHFKITSEMKEGQEYGPFRITSFSGYESIDPEFANNVKKMTQKRTTR